MSNEHRCDVTDVELESHRHQMGIANLDAAPDVFIKRFLLIRIDLAKVRRHYTGLCCRKSMNDFAKDRR